MRITRESPPAGTHTDDFARPPLAQTGPSGPEPYNYRVDQAVCNPAYDRLRVPTVASRTRAAGLRPHRVLNRFAVARTVAACARIAGIGHVHPHQLRHTLATQSINNGMSLEAVSAMLGHRSMRMTLAI